MKERKTQATKIIIYNWAGSFIIAISTMFTSLNKDVLLKSPIQNLLFVSLTSAFMFWDILSKLPDIEYTKQEIIKALILSIISLFIFIKLIIFCSTLSKPTKYLIISEIFYCIAFSQSIYGIFALICIYINKKISKKDLTMELDKSIKMIIPSIKDIKSYFDNKEKLNFERNNDMHKKMEWHQKVYNLEIQDTYTVKDLVILNALINPYDHGDILDNYINSVITDIISEISGIEKDSKKIKNEGLRYEAICDVNTKLNEKETAKIKSTPTLFDFPINNGLLKKSLNPEQSTKVRECAHLLLKND